MGHLRIALSTALAVLAAAAPAQAAGRPPLRPLPAAKGAVVTDGTRWAAYRVDDEHARVVDSRATRGRVFEVIDHCAVAAVSAAGLLGDCRVEAGVHARAPDPPCVEDLFGWLFDVRTGHVTNMPLLLRRQFPQGPPSCRYVAAGRRWVRVHLEALHLRTDAYLARRGAAARYLDLKHPRVIADLDAPGLTRTMCAPLRQRIDDQISTTAFNAYDYRRPFGVTLDPHDGLVLERCGRTRPRVLDACRPVTCSSWQLGGGWVTWLNDGIVRTLHAYRVRDGRHLRWLVRAPDDARTVTAAHTAARVYVSAAGSRTEVRAARLPR